MESFSLYFTPYHVMLWVQHRLFAHPRHRNHSPMNFRNQNLKSTPLPVSSPCHSLIHRKQSPSPTPITACTNNHAQPKCESPNKALSSQNSETHNFIKQCSYQTLTKAHIRLPLSELPESLLSLPELLESLPLSITTGANFVGARSSSISTSFSPPSPPEPNQPHQSHAKSLMPLLITQTQTKQT